ncbi:hypothetical protein, partial [Acinetobacter baumannii]|uniref:hypothetical protein n=1 Tax=Acinetobacter baumannii TaxID=470 RepID=UPI00227BE623
MKSYCHTAGNLNRIKIGMGFSGRLLLNPFGPQNPEDANVWNELGVEGKYLKANLDTTTVDFTASRP